MRRRCYANSLRYGMIEHSFCRYSYIMTQPNNYKNYEDYNEIHHDKVKKEFLHMEFLLDLYLHEESQHIEESVCPS